MNRFMRIVFGMVLIVSFVSYAASGAFGQSDEEITITTFYPSPYGQYQIVRCVPNNTVGTGGCSNAGEIHYDSGSNTLYLCDGTNWVELGGNAGSYYWAPSGGGIHNIRSSGVMIEGKLTVNGDAEVHGRIDADGVIHSRAGSDLAEGFLAEAGIEAGDVVRIDPQTSKRIVKTTIPYDTRAAGIISQEPGLLLGPEVKDDYRPLALQGNVPCKVTTENGAIEPGDLLTSSSKAGYAMKLTLVDYQNAEDLGQLRQMMNENEKRRLAVVGKALESLPEGEGKIRVLLTK